MSQSVMIAIVAFAVVFIVVTIVHNRNFRRRMRALAAERSGESICQFVRSLPYRQLDPSVVRHVYNAVQAEVAIPDSRLPIRATDHCTDTLEIDPRISITLLRTLPTGVHAHSRVANGTLSMDEFRRSETLFSFCALNRKTQRL